MLDYHVGGGQKENKCLWRVGFRDSGRLSATETWSSTMLYLHPPAVWCTKWLKFLWRGVCTKMCRPIPKQFLQALAWHGLTRLKTCWGSIVHITQQWMTTSWQMGSDLVLPTRLKLQHHQAAQPTLGELEMKDLLLRIGPQLEKIVMWVLRSCLRIYRHDCFSSICDIFFWGAAFKLRQPPKRLKPMTNMNQYEAVWSSHIRSWMGFECHTLKKKKIILKFLWYLTKKHANNWKVHQFLSRASREVTLAFPPSFATSMRRRPSATWRNGDVMRWGERQTKPGRWVKWVKSGAGAPKYAAPKICWSLMNLFDYFWAFVLQENQRHRM